MKEAMCSCGHALSDHNPLTGRCYGDAAQCDCRRFEPRTAPADRAPQDATKERRPRRKPADSTERRQTA